MGYEDKGRSVSKVGVCLKCGKLRLISVKTCVCGDCVKEAI